MRWWRARRRRRLIERMRLALLDVGITAKLSPREYEIEARSLEIVARHYPWSMAQLLPVWARLQAIPRPRPGLVDFLEAAAYSKADPNRILAALAWRVVAKVAEQEKHADGGRVGPRAGM